MLPRYRYPTCSCSLPSALSASCQSRLPLGHRRQSRSPLCRRHSPINMLHCGAARLTPSCPRCPSSADPPPRPSARSWDDRPPNASYALGNFVVDRPRLPIGQLRLRFAGHIVAARLRLNLWDAELAGVVNTSVGAVRLRVLASAAHALADVMVVELAVLQGAERPRWIWMPSLADSTWSFMKGYVFNPPPQVMACALDRAINVTVQRHLRGTSHATALLEHALDPGHSLLYITISDVLNDGAAWACAEVARARAIGLAMLVREHQAWWHAYYPQAFVTFSDTRLESFYWIQMYKLASATRPGRQVYDLQGPWFVENTPWPDLHWDLNIQVSQPPQPFLLLSVAMVGRCHCNSSWHR